MRVECVDSEVHHQLEASDKEVIWNCSWKMEGNVAEGLCPLAMVILHVYIYDQTRIHNKIIGLTP